MTLLKVCVEKDGDVCFSANYIAPEGVLLGAWLANQRKRMDEGVMEPDRARKLMSLGVPPVKKRRAYRK